MVFVTAALAARFGGFSDETSGTLEDIGHGALIVWGLDELLRGATPLRRVLGVLVLAWQVAGLVS